MRRLQILMDEELDDALERLAARRRVSKSALIRELVRKEVKPLPPLEEDPLWQMVGADSFDPVAPEDIDKVVYEDEYERETKSYRPASRASRRAARKVPARRS